MKTDLFSPVTTAISQICWYIECSTFTASSFRILNSSTGIPSPPYNFKKEREKNDERGWPSIPWGSREFLSASKSSRPGSPGDTAEVLNGPDSEWGFPSGSDGK